MFLELSEVFVCPLCRPAQGLVVIVEEMEGRRLLEGALGCPECETRFPVRRGVIRFDRPTREGEELEDAGEGRSGSRETAETSPGEAREATPGAGLATEVAALLGVERAKGYLLLGPGLEEVAGRVAALAEDAEVLAFLPAREAGGGEDGDQGGGEAEPAEGASRARGVDPEALPLLDGRMAGAALLEPGTAAVREAARSLGAGGRLALLRPGPGLEEVVAGAGLEVLAAERRALVAVRGG